MDFDRFARSAIMSVFGNRHVAALAQRYGLSLGAGRFVAGDTPAAALAAVAALNAKSVLATLDHLGEAIADRRAARQEVQEYTDLLERIQKSGIQANISLKPTALGLAIDPELAYASIYTIAAQAARLGNFVRIDMEDSPFTDHTLTIYRRLRQEGLDNVGVVIQSYLRRSDRDLTELAKLQANVRLVKGAYKEPPHLAYPDKSAVDAAFCRHINLRLCSGLYTAVATHDSAVIAFTRRTAAEHAVPKDQFEFQMLYGIRRDLQENLAAAGYRVRCYVPYGTHWYPYFMRRLAERPANVLFVLQNLLRP